MSYGPPCGRPAGIEPRFSVQARRSNRSNRHLHHRLRPCGRKDEIPGNGRVPYCLLRGDDALPLSYGDIAGWIRTIDLHLSEVTGLFTTGRLKKHAGERAISAFDNRNAGSALRPPRDPRRTHLSRRIPRYDRLKAVSRRWREVSEIFTTSVRCARVRGQIEKQIPSQRSGQYRAAEANPLWFALLSVSGLRLVPSSRPRACGAHALPRERPGSGSPVPARRRRFCFRTGRRGGNKKPSGARLGRVCGEADVGPL